MRLIWHGDKWHGVLVPAEEPWSAIPLHLKTPGGKLPKKIAPMRSLNLL